MLNSVNALILGIVEGITEFLPISSTGHLMITAELMGLAQSDFMKSFEIAIQFGAILSVMVLYWKKLLKNFEIMKRVLVAFLPTAAIGFLLYKLVKSVLLENTDIVAWSLLIGGAVIIIFEKYFAKRAVSGEDDLAKISYKKYVLVGIIQSISIIPGVSRSAATILGGLGLGFSRRAIVEFSFLLAAPTMLAATGYDLLKSAGEFSSNQLGFLLIGFAASFVTAIVAIKFLLNFIKSRTFILFGIYRMIVALLLILL